MTTRIFSGSLFRTRTVADAAGPQAAASRPVPQVVDDPDTVIHWTTPRVEDAAEIPFAGAPVSPVERVELAAPTAATASVSGPNGAKLSEDPAAPDRTATSLDREYVLGNPSVYANMLGDYHSPIANWRFFVTEDKVLKNSFAEQHNPSAADSVSFNYYAFLQNVNQITLIETGVTGYNIKEVVVESVIGTTEQNRAMNALSFIVRFSEPYGTTFMDALIQSCARLRIPNWRFAPFHLELSFKGINPETGMPHPIPFRRIWAVYVFDITCTFDAGTVHYEMLLRPYNHVAFGTEYSTLKKNEAVPAKTLGEALKGLCQHMTETPDRLEAGGFYKPYIKYDYRFHAAALKHIQGGANPDEWNIAPHPSTGEALATGFKIEDAGGRTVVHFGSNSRFEQIVELLIATTVEGHDMMGIAKAVARQAGGGDGKYPDRLIKLGNTTQQKFYVFRIEPQVKLLDFNDLTGDYDKEITYHIYFFEFSTLILDRKQVEYYTTKAGQRHRWAEIRKRINKTYDYTYTGLNTEVLDLRMEVNMLYKVPLPLSAGQYDFGLVRDGKFLDESRWKDIVEVRRLRQFLKLTGEKQQADSDRERYRHQATTPEEADAQAEVIERQATTTRDLTEFESVPENRSMVARGLGMIREAVAPPPFQGSTAQPGEVRTAPPTSVSRIPPLTPGRPEYAEDALGDISGAISYYNTDLLGSLKVAFREESAREGQTDYHLQVEGQYRPQRTLFGSLMNQVFGPNQDFLNIELQIRGDVWWLGADTYQLMHYAATGGQSTANAVFMSVHGEQPVANMLEHSHMFLLRFGTPVGYDPDTGLPQVGPGGMFEGVYEVIKVRSHFDETGKFIQTLTAKRDNLTVITPQAGGGPEVTAPTPMGTPTS